MGSLFNSTHNTRFVPGSDNRVIRSDVPCALTEQETEWLIHHSFQTVIDLRTSEEQAEKPCCLCGRPGFHYIRFPIFGGSTVPSAPDDVSKSYIAMCDERMNQIVKTILTSPTGILYFCNAGKDRTGVVTALLMKQYGCSDREIIEDYLVSKDNLMSTLTEYAHKNPGVSLEVITPCERYMREFLDWCDGQTVLSCFGS